MFSTTDLGAALRDLRYSLARDSSALARRRAATSSTADSDRPRERTKERERSASIDLFYDGSQLDEI